MTPPTTTSRISPGLVEGGSSPRAMARRTRLRASCTTRSPWGPSRRAPRRTGGNRCGVLPDLAERTGERVEIHTAEG